MSYKAVESRRDCYGQWFVLLQRSQDDLHYCVDVWVDTEYGDVDADWNQYVFFSTEEDRHRESVQSKDSEFDKATNEAIDYLVKIGELKQDEHSHWHCGIPKEDWCNE